MLKKLQIFFDNSWDNFQQFTLDVIYGNREGWAVKIYGIFLSVLSYFFSGLVQLRLWLYDKSIFSQEHLGCPVIAVGNLTVGGTGKTPVVEKLARILISRGRKVAILSRGYKSKKEPFWKRWLRMITHQEVSQPKVVSDGKRILLDSEQAGDEPFMLASNLPEAVVIVDKNRVKAGSFAIKKFGVDVLILDDGFQYLSLKKQLNILLIDRTNPFGNKHLLPRGVLREPTKHLKRASFVFITKSNGAHDDKLNNYIRRYNPDVSIMDCRHVPKSLQGIHTDESLPLSFLSGKRINIFSGIADPASFEAFLLKLEAIVVYHRRFADHHRYSMREIKHFIQKLQETKPECIVTTEKDAVRLDKKIVFPIPIYYLRLEVETVEKKHDFYEAVSRLSFPEKEISVLHENYAHRLSKDRHIFSPNAKRKYAFKKDYLTQQKFIQRISG